MESAPIRYFARVVDVTGFLILAKTSVYIPYKALSMWYCVYYIHTDTFIILATFLFQVFLNTKICHYTPRNDKKKQQTKTKRSTSLSINDINEGKDIR